MELVDEKKPTVLQLCLDLRMSIPRFFFGFSSTNAVPWKRIVKRSTRANGPVKMSFSILRDQFSSLPVEEQLQFLSWLFQGALSQCLYTSTSMDRASALGSISGEEETSTQPPVQLLLEASVVDIEYPYSSRKGLLFSVEEDRLLVQLRKEEALTWSEVIKRFSQRFPGRSKGSI
jgi:hypothetical protein